MRALKYLAFFLAVFSFMVFFGHQETLNANEALAISEFEARSAQEAAQPVQVASETPAPPLTFVSTQPATPTSTGTSATGAIPSTYNGQILEDSVNVRSGPGLDYPVVTQLYKWDPVILGSLANGWFELYIDGHKYYISAEFAALNPVQ